MDWLVVVFASASGAAIIKLLESVIMWKLNRGALKEDKCDINHKVLKDAIRVILHDRIKYLGRSYLVAGSVSFDDRKDLVEMHGIYHNDLDGNGNLDYVMSEVMKLPLKQ